jgi:glycosyltransferase involved in cell wall biosynthesis
MLNLLYDPQIFALQSFGVISRIFSELYRQFQLPQFSINARMPFSVGNNVYAQNVGIRHKALLPQKCFIDKNRIQFAIAKAFTIPKLLSSRFDLFHPTYYNPYFIKYLGNKPFVFTVFDMIHEFYAEKYFQHDRSISQQKRYLAERARRIIVISQTAKDDLVRLFGVDPDNVDVVYLGNSLQVTGQNGRPQSMGRQRYLLFVGNRERYKNFSIFVRAVVPVLKKHDDINVVCAGGGAFNAEERGMMEKLNVADRFIARFVSDDELACYYHHAEAFIFPSLYEGFGIPLVEAFASGCPVIASDIPVFREVAGSAALYFDPLSEDGLREQVEKTVNSQSLKDTLIAQGLEQLKKYTWNRTAQRTKEVYLKVLGS